MTTLQKIIKDAKSLRAKNPKKYSKWTDYVKEASKKYASKNKTVKKKATKRKVGVLKPNDKHKDSKSHNVNIRVLSGVKNKKSPKKAVKRSNTLTKVRIGACNRMSLQHYKDICNKIEEVIEDIMFLNQEAKNKTKSLNYRNNIKKDLIEDKKYLKELKIQKSELKKLL
jgi:hypothetical protein